MTLEEALAKITELEASNVSLTTTNAELTTQATDKDTKIAELGEHLKEKGRQFKQLREMSKEEKELLTERELELLERQEINEKGSAELKTQQDKFFADQRAGVLKTLIERHSRGDVEFGKKIELNLSKIKDSDLAMNEASLLPLVKDAFNMVGSDIPDAVRNAHNQGGDIPYQAPKDSGFAESEKGIATSDAMFGKDQTNQ